MPAFDDFVTGASGAFLGALAAYLFERWKDRRDQTDIRHSAVLRAQMALIFHESSLENMRRELEQYRGLPQRETRIPYVWHTPDSFSIDVDSLSFFLDGHAPDLLMAIYLADKGYHNATGAIGDRNDVLRDLQSTATVHQFDPETGVAQMSVDSPKAKLLRDTTDAMYSCLDKALSESSAVSERLRVEAKKIFPKRKLLRSKPVGGSDPDNSPLHTEVGRSEEGT